MDSLIISRLNSLNLHFGLRRERRLKPLDTFSKRELDSNNDKYDNAFTSIGFSHWKNGPARFNDHQAASYHKEAFERWKTTLQSYNDNTDILKLVNQQHSKQATENRLYLKEVIRTVHFLA